MDDSAQDRRVAKQIAYHGAVYCVGVEQCRFVKIGHAVDVCRRIKDLQTGSPRKLSLLGFIPGTRLLEREFHQMFSHLRISREWFSDSNYEITSTFAQLLQLFKEGALSL
jgi:hypothetical protein